MVLCPYGSVPKSGAPAYVWLTWLDAKAWLGTAFPQLSWIGYLVPPVLKEVTSFCATEPPQPVAPSNATVTAAPNDPIAFEALIQFVKDSIYWWVWSNTCVCNPSPSAPPTCATGWSSSFVPVAVGPGGSQFIVATRFTNIQIGAQMSGFRVWTPQAYNYDVGLTLWTPAGANLGGLTVIGGIPAGYHEYTISPITLTAGLDYLTSMCVHVGYQWYSDATAPTNDSIAHWVGEQYGTNCAAFPSTVVSTFVGVQPILCVAAGPTSPGQPPVPSLTTPDFPMEGSCTTQDLCDLLQQTLQSVTMLRTMVDLIQRQEVPFAYITGTVHSGLTGDGSFSVSDILGLLVQVSTVPPKWGLSSDNPARYIPAPAMVSVGTVNGDQDTHFVHFTEELYFPEAMGAMTKVTYQFKPGVHGAITELVREP